MYLITSYEDAEKYIGRKADKNRKIYNGMMKTYFLPVYGPQTSQTVVRRAERIETQQYLYHRVEKTALSRSCCLALAGLGRD